MGNVDELAEHWGQIHGSQDQSRFEQKEIALTDAQWERCAHDAGRREALDQRILDKDFQEWQGAFVAVYHASHGDC